MGSCVKQTLDDGHTSPYSMTKNVRHDRRLWSVTTLLKGGVPKGDALVGWAAKVTAEYAVENVDMLRSLVASGHDEEALYLCKRARFRRASKAQARGTEVHAVAEAINLGQTVDVSDEIRPYVDQYVAFLREHSPTFECAEAPVYNLTWGYAGTLDAIAVIDGRRCVLDIKTTDKRPGQPRPPYPETALQLCAYARSEGVGVNPERFTVSGGRRYYVLTEDEQLEPMPEIEGAFALIVSPYDFQLVPAAIDEPIWEAFLHAREIARWSFETSKTVLGAPV